MKLSNRKH